MMNILYLLPKNLISRLVGWFVHIRWPQPLAAWTVRCFGNFYKINFAEAEKPVEQYASIGDFFIRKLKEGVRPLAEATVVHPADSRISQIGFIEAGRLIQAKGKTYPVDVLLEDPEALKKFEGGLFATYYLCPTDYHRVHSPVSGEITAVTHVPGHLWPVNEWSVNRIEELFCVNERVIVEIKTTEGPVALVLVGATNVGQISLSFEPKIISNQRQQRTLQKILYTPHLPLQKGDEIGVFHMGSTVVMCYSASVANKKSLEEWRQFVGQVRVRGYFW